MTKLTLFAAVLLAALLCGGCAARTRYTQQTNTTQTPTQSKSATHWEGFRLIPPIADADPLVRSRLTVSVPTRFSVQRSTSTLSIKVDRSLLEPARITVGSKLVTGVRSELFVYPEGDTRPAQARSLGLWGGLDFNLGTSILNSDQGGIPVPGTKYVVELDLVIFETDIPPQHMWGPYGKNYRVLWKRTLRQTVE